MILTQKLLGFLHSVFDKDARSFIAFRLRHQSGAFSWKVHDRVLQGFNGDAELFSVELEPYTIRTLLEFLATLPGVTVSSGATTEQMGLSACALIDGSGQQVLSNGDQVHAFTSLLWAYLESLSVELKEARTQIDNALRQMNIKDAQAEWLDEWGGYFGIPRLNGELDADYGPRIILEVLRPRGNNKAIEIALNDKFGQTSRVIDVQKFGPTEPIYNGESAYDGSILHNAVAQPYYGLFKIVIGYDLLGGADISGYLDEVRTYVDTLRDAGTHLESIELGGSQIDDAFPFSPTDGGDIQILNAIATLADSFTAPTEAFPTIAVSIAALSDALSPPTDGVSGSIVYTTMYDGMYTYDGSTQHMGGTTQSLTLS